MTGTKNLMILGMFFISEIRLQTLAIIVDYEAPPSLPHPLYAYSQVSLSQYPDVPMLTKEEMRHAFPWLNSAVPIKVQPAGQPLRNAQQYVVYYSPTEPIANTNSYSHAGVNGNSSPEPEKLRSDQRNNLLPIQLREEGKLRSSGYHPVYYVPDPSINNGPVKAHATVVEKAYSNSQDHREIPNLSYVAGRNKQIFSNVKQQNAGESGKPIGSRKCREGKKKLCERVPGKLITKVENSCHDNCSVRDRINVKSRKCGLRKGKIKLSTRDRAIPRPEWQSFENHDAEGNDYYYKELDDTKNREIHRAESKQRSSHPYPKVPSAYLKPPKLTLEDQHFYRSKKGKSEHKKRKCKENADRGKLEKHQLRATEKTPAEVEDSLESHRAEYVRDHAPEHQTEEEEEEEEEEKLETESTDTEEKVQKTKPTDALELSPDGDRVDFQIHGHEGPKTYIFGFDTGDGKNRHFRLEERLKDGTVKGHYGYYDAKGKLKMVHYTARPHEGYQEKHHESNHQQPES